MKLILISHECIKKTIVSTILVMIFLLMFTNLCYATEDSNQYEILGKSYDGFRVAMNSDGLEGYVDTEGEPLTPFIYEGALDFNNGIGLAYTGSDKDREYSAINTKGDILKFNKTLGTVSFYNGQYGFVQIASGLEDQAIPVKSALIDSNGNLITEYCYDDIFTLDGTPTAKINLFVTRKNGYWGAIKGDGTIVIPNEYDHIQISSPQSNVFTVLKTVGTSIKYGYIRFDGKVLFSCTLDDGADFIDGYNLIIQDGKPAIIDMNGNFIVDFGIYDEISFPFKEGLAIVKNSMGYGCINQNGSLVIPCQYNSITPSQNGYLKVVLKNNTTETTLENPLIAQRDINVYLNNNWLYLDQAPIIENGRTLAPFRTISEALGYTVTWDNKNQTITLQNDEKIIYLEIGSNTAYIDIFNDKNKAEAVSLDAPAELINGRTFVPLRFISENIDATIAWNPTTKTVNIQK